MPRAYVLMTALPPTKGHLSLIKFARELSSDVRVIVCTQPSEPYPAQRMLAIQRATSGMGGVIVHWMDEEIEQDTQAPGFWEMWKNIMTDYGAKKGDYVVGSEPYGKAVADLFGGVFMPYDLDREFEPIKATKVRRAPGIRFDDIIPEFQTNLVTRVTIFGAESTGKTTLARALPKNLLHYNARFVFEYARPLLESTSSAINVPVMERIWEGQLALQRHVLNNLGGSPVIIQDTDLWSTVGYWAQPHWESELGPIPKELILDAQKQMADLYIILKGNIPFEEDPIRYGGDKRESPDDYWIDLAKTWNLPYVVVDSGDRSTRVALATALVNDRASTKLKTIRYERSHND